MELLSRRSSDRFTWNRFASWKSRPRRTFLFPVCSAIIDFTYQNRLGIVTSMSCTFKPYALKLRRNSINSSARWTFSVHVALLVGLRWKAIFLFVSVYL